MRGGGGVRVKVRVGENVLYMCTKLFQTINTACNKHTWWTHPPKQCLHLQFGRHRTENSHASNVRQFHSYNASNQIEATASLLFLQWRTKVWLINHTKDCGEQGCPTPLCHSKTRKKLKSKTKCTRTRDCVNKSSLELSNLLNNGSHTCTLHPGAVSNCPVHLLNLSLGDEELSSYLWSSGSQPF